VVDSSDKIMQLLSQFQNFRIIDLSHTLENGVPTYPTHPKYSLNPWPSMGDPAEINVLMLGDHTGTHVDSPSHFVRDLEHPQRKHIDEIELDTLIGRAVKLTFGPFEANNTLVTQADIMEWEHKNNVFIQKNDIVLIDFQWGQAHWNTVPEGFSFLEGWPGLGKDAVEYLKGKQVKVVGTDCMSLDSADGGRGELPSHYGFLPNGILIMENLANLSSVPVISFFMALPLKIKHATGSPIRAIVLI
jgi:arylformamidase